MLRVVLWGAFVWGALMCAVASYYGMHWFGEPHNLRLNEVKIGYMMGLFYGWPVWVGLPIAVTAAWGYLPSWERVTLLAPPALALGLFVAGQVLSRA